MKLPDAQPQSPDTREYRELVTCRLCDGERAILVRTSIYGGQAAIRRGCPECNATGKVYRKKHTAL